MQIKYDINAPYFIIEVLYICYTYSDIEVDLCLKALVTHLALGHVACARVILV